MFFDLLEKLFGTSHILWFIVPVLIYLVLRYNSLVTVKHNVAKALSNIDVLLKQRHEELPKLIATCKQYMQHEQTTLEKVIQARNRVATANNAGDIDALGIAEGALRQSLGSLFALSESYPDLKADQQFTHLQTRISSLENNIADRREFYNEAVTINNARIEQFPDVIISRLLNFPAFKTLNFDVSELSDVNVQARFAG
ncbi:MAG: LemA family protein [Lysobacteraceae bacterium]